MAQGFGWRKSTCGAGSASVCGVEGAGGAVQGLGEDDQLGGGEVGIVGVDGLVYAGNDDGRVAGELAGSVDGVPVPRAIGEAGVGR